MRRYSGGNTSTSILRFFEDSRMAASLRFARKAGPLPWVIGPTLVLALFVGCAHSQKSNAAKSTSPQASAQPAPAKPAVATPAAAKLSTPAKPEKSAPAPALERSKPQAAAEALKTPGAKEPPARQTAEAVPASADWPVPQDRPMTDQERDALAAMIRAAAEEGQKRQAAEPPKPKIEVKATVQPAAEHGAAKKEGCGAGGATAIDLTPPPLDKPQPKAEFKQQKIIARDVWRGKTAEFNFTLTNAGEGPLAIRIKKP
jgi:hypothetical protein